MLRPSSDTDDVVDEQRGKDTGKPDDCDEHALRGVRPGRGPTLRAFRKKSTDAQVSDDDHHAEEQDEGCGSRSTLRLRRSRRRRAPASPSPPTSAMPARFEPQERQPAYRESDVDDGEDIAQGDV